MIAEQRTQWDHTAAQRLVSSLHEPCPAVYWTDLLVTAAIAWPALAAAIWMRSPWGRLAALTIATCALYRGLCFIHELTHLRERSLPGFETVWNVLFGVPMLIPSLAYVGVHQNHHRPATYGTEQDPEYQPFAGSPGRIAVFALQGVLLPLLLAVRFLLLAPVALVLPGFHRNLLERASSFSFNPQYRRDVSQALIRKATRWEVTILGSWAAVGVLLSWRVLPWRVLVLWYAVSATVSVVNSLRTLGAHRYTSDGEPMDRAGQIEDSIDTPGGWWTELWAPVGLRYHALHHYFPGIPYHNLGQAYRRLMESLPTDSAYRGVTSPALLASLESLAHEPAADR